MTVTRYVTSLSPITVEVPGIREAGIDTFSVLEMSMFADTNRRLFCRFSNIKLPHILQREIKLGDNTWAFAMF